MVRDSFCFIAPSPEVPELGIQDSHCKMSEGCAKEGKGKQYYFTNNATTNQATTIYHLASHTDWTITKGSKILIKSYEMEQQMTAEKTAKIGCS